MKKSSISLSEIGVLIFWAHPLTISAIKGRNESQEINKNYNWSLWHWPIHGANNFN